MKTPRDVGAVEVAKALRVFGCTQVRQDGSHLRLTTQLNGTHHLTIPNHRALKTGTLLGGLLKPVADHHRITVEEVIGKLGL